MATLYAVRQGEMRRGRPAEKSFPSERAAADGAGGVGGKGLASPCPLPLAGEATTPGGRAEAVARGRATARKRVQPCAGRSHMSRGYFFPVRPCGIPSMEQIVAFAPFRLF